VCPRSQGNVCPKTGLLGFFGLGGNLLYRIAANLGTDFDGVVPKTSRLSHGRALAATEPIYYFAQHGHDRVDNLISRRNRASGSALAGALSNSTQFPFDGAQVVRNGGHAGVEFPRAMLKHPFSPALNPSFRVGLNGS
jgi:hypothetical protein